MEYIDFVSVLIATILQIILGMVWYGKPMFMKTWMKINNISDQEMLDAKNKSMGHLYALQILASFIANATLYYILERFVMDDSMYLGVAITIWFGFTVTLTLGGVLWEKLTDELKVKKFLVTSGYQLVAVILAVVVLLYV